VTPVVDFRIYIDVAESRAKMEVIFFVNIEDFLLSEEVPEYHLQETMVRVHVYASWRQYLSSTASGRPMIWELLSTYTMINN
jgi:hypothetical protein